jgi:hypothetical protein
VVLSEEMLGKELLLVGVGVPWVAHSLCPSFRTFP